MAKARTYWNAFLPSFLDRMSFHMRKNISTIVEPYGLNSSQAMYILALYIQDGQTLVGLSRFLDLDNANTNRVIKVLKDKGYVYDDRKDERSKKYHIFLTDSGKEVAAYIGDSIDRMNEVYSTGLRDDELEITQMAMLKISNNAMIGFDLSDLTGKKEDSNEEE